jgi:uncharacterized protein (DUF1778 family)
MTEERQAIETTQTIRLSAEDQRRFVELILNPPEPNAALCRAFEAHRDLFGSERALLAGTQGKKP